MGINLKITLNIKYLTLRKIVIGKKNLYIMLMELNKSIYLYIKKSHQLAIDH